jgi:hypothetical protein
LGCQIATRQLKALNKELTSMVLIQALPDEYSHFVLLLLFMDKLEKNTGQQTFITEEIQRCRHAADTISVFFFFFFFF